MTAGANAWAARPRSLRSGTPAPPSVPPPALPPSSRSEASRDDPAAHTASAGLGGLQRRGSAACLVLPPGPAEPAEAAGRGPQRGEPDGRRHGKDADGSVAGRTVAGGREAC